MRILCEIKMIVHSHHSNQPIDASGLWTAIWRFQGLSWQSKPHKWPQFMIWFLLTGLLHVLVIRGQRCARCRFQSILPGRRTRCRRPVKLSRLWDGTGQWWIKGWFRILSECHRRLESRVQYLDWWTRRLCLGRALCGFFHFQTGHRRILCRYSHWWHRGGAVWRLRGRLSLKYHLGWIDDRRWSQYLRRRRSQNQRAWWCHHIGGHLGFGHFLCLRIKKRRR